ncbi:LexA family protein [Meridianimaribacter flavus]|uniref:DNA polymerase V n=1 Tax=Meridianimaribacter flavus TaxID=571115 RepID=A0ABY2G2S9_9FLAO|nr:translesion error-prone DNA polymerase V autoproteolytic subunit [Meridianimaribacter flavus]TDY10580.1 DNA polymerase V [Meridianimaribacter flavus]
MSLKFLTPKNALEFYSPDDSHDLEVVLAQTGISAGFPSPADDFKEFKISLDKTLVKNKEATFYARVSGQSMIGAGLDDGDLLVVDKSLEPQHNKIAVCFIDGEFTVKRLRVTKEGVYLQPENPAYEPLLVTNDNDFQIWGIVTHVIKKTI